MRRPMQVGDVIKMTSMPVSAFPKFTPPLYALAIEKRPTDSDPNYHRLVILEGTYTTDKVPGETFHLPGRPMAGRELNWHIVPQQRVPDRIWAALAAWRLTNG